MDSLGFVPFDVVEFHREAAVLLQVKACVGWDGIPIYGRYSVWGGGRRSISCYRGMRLGCWVGLGRLGSGRGLWRGWMGWTGVECGGKQGSAYQNKDPQIIAHRRSLCQRFHV